MFKFLIPVALLASSIVAAPTPAPLEERQDPMTVQFTPYKYLGCVQDYTPVHAKPSTFSVTSGTCFNSPYKFGSYFDQSNFDPATTPCVLSIYPEADCQGRGEAATLFHSYGECKAEQLNPVGASFMLTCGA